MHYEIFKKYIGLKFKAVEINSKKIPTKPWKDTKGSAYTADALYSMVPPPHIIVFDIDVKDGKPGLESFERFQKDFNTSFVYNVKTGSGGFHYYCYYPTNLPHLDRIQKNYPGIDFLHYGALCVAGGQTLDNGEYILNPDRGLDINSGLRIPKDTKLLTFKGVTNDAVKYKNGIITSLSNNTDCGDLPVPCIQICLDLIEADDYFVWRDIGMALNQHLGDAGFPLFLKWSMKSDKFRSEEDVHKYWRSFRPREEGEPRITFGTLVYKALESKFITMSSELRLVHSREEAIEILTDSKYTSFPKFNEKFISNTIPSFLTSVPIFENIPLNELKTLCKQAFQPDPPEPKPRPNPKDLPFDFSNIIRVVPFLGKNSYYHILCDEFVDERWLEAKIAPYRKELSEEYDVKKFTIKIAEEVELIRAATVIEYNLKKNERFYLDEKGRWVFNKFDWTSVPPFNYNPTPAGKKLIRMILLHAELLLGTIGAEIMLSYFAFLVQNPGCKILWAPILYSMPGVGKSLLILLLAYCLLGSQNYHDTTINEICGTNTGWVANVALVIISEFKLTKTDSRVIENLKPLITEPFVRYIEKYMVAQTIPNQVNFIITSNWEAPLPITPGDRRFCVLYCEPKNKAEMFRRISECSLEHGFQTPKEYFGYLDDMLQCDESIRGEVRAFFKNYKLSEHFNPHVLPEYNNNEDVFKRVLEEDPNNDYYISLLSQAYNDSLPPYIDSNYLMYFHIHKYDDSEGVYKPHVTPHLLKKALTSFGYIKYRSWYYRNTIDSAEALEYILIQKQKNKQLVSESELESTSEPEASDFDCFPTF